MSSQVGLQSKESNVATVSHLTRIFDNFYIITFTDMPSKEKIQFELS